MLLLHVIFSILVAVTTCWQRHGFPDGPKRYQWSAVMYAHKREGGDVAEENTPTVETNPVEKEVVIPPEIPSNPPEPTKEPTTSTTTTKEPTTTTTKEPTTTTTKEPTTTTTKEPTPSTTKENRETTKKPEEEREPTSTKGPVPAKEPFPHRDVAPPSTFAVWNTLGKICILAKFEASFTIVYSTSSAEQDGTVKLPKDAVSRGHCGTSTTDPELQVEWPGFRFTVTFTTISKENEDVQESWSGVSSMKLQYDTSQRFFDGATNAGNKTARTKSKDVYFETPIAMSYFCPSPEVVPLYNSKDKKMVTMRMKEFQIQAYNVKSGAFSPAWRCNQVEIGGAPEPYIQDETIPIAVGSTLAILTLLSVGGFAVYRAVTVRRVDYSTME